MPGIIIPQNKPLTKVITISLPTASWTAHATIENCYTQVVIITDTTANTKIDLQADAAVINQMVEDGTTALYIENNNNVITAYAVGEKPSVDLSVQATRYEVANA